MAQKTKLIEAYTEFTTRGYSQFAGRMTMVRSLAQRAISPFRKLATVIKNIFSPRGLLSAGVAGFGVFGLLKLASTAEETQNAFRMVFGEMHDDAEAFVQKLSKTLGRAPTELRESMMGFQGFFLGMDASRENALHLSKVMQQLQLDFQSFRDMPMEEAGERLMSALAGEVRPLRRFGIDISEARISQELLNQGFKKGSEHANRLAKALAVMKVLIGTFTKQKVIGDLARTMGSMANESRRMLSRLKELGETLGNFLTPIFKELANLASAFSETFQRAAAGALPKVKKVLDGIGGIIRQIAADVRGADFSHWKAQLGHIWDAFRAIIGAAKDLLLAGIKAIGEALEQAMKNAVLGAIKEMQGGLASIYEKYGWAIAPGTWLAGKALKSGVDVSELAKPSQETFGQATSRIGEELRKNLGKITDQWRSEREGRKGGIETLYFDEAKGNYSRTPPGAAGESKEIVDKGRKLIGELLAAMVGDQAGKEAGRGAFSAVGFAALQGFMQQNVSKGEEKMIKLAEEAAGDRKEIIKAIAAPKPAVAGA